MVAEVESLTLMKQAGAAAFYGASSLLIIMVNKAVLTSYGFPSFQFLGLGQMLFGMFALILAGILSLITGVTMTDDGNYHACVNNPVLFLFQMLATLVVLQVGKLLKIITFDDISLVNIQKVFPLPLLYVGNLFFGLGGTQMISLPMFVVLRRFTLLFTMIGEQYYLGIRSSVQVQVSIVMMILGALVAAVNDLSFQLIGYLFILINNLCTTANVLVSKKIIDKSEGLNKYGILFYNALVSLPPALLLAYYTGDIHEALQYDRWNNPIFIVLFLLSCVMGFILMYSILLCTAINSPLTTMVTGCIKNIGVTYAGMVFGGDYVYSLTNFVGINVSAIGSLVYSYIKYAEQQEKQQEKQQRKLKHNGELPSGGNNSQDVEDGVTKQDNDNPPIPPHLK